MNYDIQNRILCVDNKNPPTGGFLGNSQDLIGTNAFALTINTASCLSTYTHKTRMTIRYCFALISIKIIIALYGDGIRPMKQHDRCRELYHQFHPMVILYHYQAMIVRGVYETTT